MNILAFDTCFDACSVAVRRADAVTAERVLMRRGHAEALVPMIERTMQAAGLAFDAIDRIAVTAGPGTFTGSRVGMSAALALSVAHGVPVITYSSLQCVARAAIEQLGARAADYDGILVARDAKRDSVFIESTDRVGNELDAPALLTVTEARAVAAARQYFALGSGVPLLADDASPLALASTWQQEPPSGICEPDARQMLADAATRQPTPAPAPLYLRPPDATPSSRPPLARLPSRHPPDA